MYKSWVFLFGLWTICGVSSFPGREKTQSVKIINSTSIHESARNLLPEKTSRNVSYVYPVSTSQNSTGAVGNSTDCIYRVNENYNLVYYNQTKEQLEKDGKVIYDQVCVGDFDEEGNKISSGALASLVG